MNQGLELHAYPRSWGRIEKLALVSQTVSLSVTFYVVTYFLITLQWLETLLPIFVSTCFLYLIFDDRDSLILGMIR
jgi:hypothetical protein